MYEIKHLSPLSKKTIIIIHFIKNYFFHTLHEKCSELQCTIYNILHWFSISIHPWLTYNYNTNERKQKKKTS
jgi:isochorismate hydrolase